MSSSYSVDHSQKSSLYRTSQTHDQESESALGHLQYVQKLERDLATARRKIQECEATSTCFVFFSIQDNFD